MRNLLGCASVPDDDGGQRGVCATTNANVHIVFNLSRKNIGVRALGRKNQMDTKGTPLTGNQRKTGFNLCQQFLTRFIRARLVKQFCHLVTCKDNTLHIVPGLLAVLGNVGGINFFEKPFAFFQGICQVVQEYKEFRFFRNNVGKLLPNIRKVNTALEVSHMARFSVA